DATVYSWRDADGALHFSNDADEVPTERPEGFRAVTSNRQPPKGAEGDAAGSPDDALADDPPGAYERGLAAGLQVGEQQLRAAAGMARIMVEAAPRTTWTPPPVVVAQPPAVSVSVVRAPQRFSDEPYVSGWPFWAPWFVGPAFIGDGFSHHHRFFRFGHRLHGGGFFPGMHGRGGFSRPGR